MARKKKPQKTATLQISGLSHEGRGIAKEDGKITFVFGALTDETVNVLYTHSRGKFNEANTTEVISPASNRVTPACEYFGICGGCSLQHLKHEDQISHKQSTLQELLKHQANAEPQQWLDPITDKSLGYRRKARLSVRHVAGKQKVLVGFRERYSRFVANIDHCAILHPSIGEHLDDISAMLFTLEQRDHIPQIEVAVTDSVSALIIRHLTPLPEHDLEILKNFAIEFKLHIYLQPKGIDSIYLFQPEKDDDKLRYTLKQDKLTLAFHPAQFTQINHAINDKMIIQAINLLDLKPSDKVLDLFCGIGNFSLPAAKHSQFVTGVEGAKDAVEQAKENAVINNIDNTTFHTANLFEDCEHLPWATQRYDKLIIDPPRSGAEQILALLPHWQPDKIIYVSCNPATLARDTKQILAAGYQLTNTGIMDMFPHTQHVEAMALFTRITS
ncbi:MAG: 23S rRNA (uracil(1939)-C(5))-methyltransferase RlmD [Gammaproteobacteria bacterium]|nr:23S rRNA (uracil(1939)-C(5))-methyltransferase RlmD [Gammaproteobacteria bacterium]